MGMCLQRIGLLRCPVARFRRQRAARSSPGLPASHKKVRRHGVRNLGLRLIVWFVGVPTLIVVIFFLPFQNHLAFNVMVIVVSALAARELAGMFQKKDAGYRASGFVIPLIGAALPSVQVLILNGIFPDDALIIAIYAVAGVALLCQVARKDLADFRHSLTNTAANITVLIYPGLFLSYLVRISELPQASLVIITFLLVVFANDTLAYVVGGLYRIIRIRLAARQGKEWTQGVAFPVSPNKTIPGFIGGALAAPLTLWLAALVFPGAISGSVGRIILVGTVVGVATIMGDLIESALKRSATSKDSGSLIPGRGGILDSVDSILYAAPIFYYLFRYLL
ncbi:MAG: hypothetical protein E4H09_00320 [Spirochaetales bacterium]|nr:MAG: hypothetical protein E4H09_00320 [Spirochaetales bacterium]